MKRTLTIGGAIACAVGLLWMGQGAGYIGGSFMTDQREWLWIGLATLAAGLVALAISRRR